MTNSKYVYFILLTLLAVLSSISVFSQYYEIRKMLPERSDRPAIVEEAPGPRPPDTTRISQSCVTSMEDLEQRMNSTSMTFVLPPYKGGGSSLYRLQKFCSGAPLKPNKLLSNQEVLKDFFVLNETVPKFLMTHVVKSETLTDLIYHASPDSLIVFLYRNERDRLVSAVRHILEHRLCGSWNITEKHYEALVVEKDESKCLVGEEALVEFIRPPRKYEVTGSVRNILSCKFFDLIRENYPNIIFMEYSKQDELQRVLAKVNCPELMPQVPFRVNESGDVPNVFILRADGKQVPIMEWLKGKAHVLELLMTPPSEHAGCGLERKQIEEAISFCPERTVSSSLFFRS